MILFKRNRTVASILLFVLCCVLLIHGCAGSRPLSEAEKAKLDSQLLVLLRDDNIVEEGYDVTTRPNGEREYGVIVRSSNPDELRSAGIQVGSVFSDVITERVTKSELKKILSLPSVRFVQNSSRNYPQNK